MNEPNFDFNLIEEFFKDCSKFCPFVVYYRCTTAPTGGKPLKLYINNSVIENTTRPRLYRGEPLDLKNKWNDYYIYSGRFFNNKISRGNYVSMASFLGSKPFYANMFSEIFNDVIPKEIFDKYKDVLLNDKNYQIHNIYKEITLNNPNDRTQSQKFIVCSKNNMFCHQLQYRDFATRYFRRHTIFGKLKQQKLNHKFVVWVSQYKFHKNLIQKICKEYLSIDITKIDISILKW